MIFSSNFLLKYFIHELLIHEQRIFLRYNEIYANFIV